MVSTSTHLTNLNEHRDPSITNIHWRPSTLPRLVVLVQRCYTFMLKGLLGNVTSTIYISTATTHWVQEHIYESKNWTVKRQTVQRYRNEGTPALLLHAIGAHETLASLIPRMSRVCRWKTSYAQDANASCADSLGIVSIRQVLWGVRCCLVDMI